MEIRLDYEITVADKNETDLGFSINISYNFEILRSKRTKYHMTHFLLLFI
jgi:hypothetical protein